LALYSFPTRRSSDLLCIAPSGFGGSIHWMDNERVRVGMNYCMILYVGVCCRFAVACHAATVTLSPPLFLWQECSTSINRLAYKQDRKSTRLNSSHVA